VTAAEALPLLADSPFFKGFNRPSTGTVSATPTSSSGPLGDPPTHQGHRSAPRRDQPPVHTYQGESWMLDSPEGVCPD
jgi:hypothetical protein